MVFSKSYPLGAADLQPLIREAMAANPDAFMALSYPPDTFMLTEQMQIVGFNPPIMYVAIGGVFPGLQGQVRRQGQRHLGLWRRRRRARRAWTSTTRRTRPCTTAHREAGAVNVYAAPSGPAAGDRDGRRDRPQEDPRRDRQAAPSRRVWGDIKYEEPAQRQSLGRSASGRTARSSASIPANKAGAKPLLFPKPQVVVTCGRPGGRTRVRPEPA